MTVEHEPASAGSEDEKWEPVLECEGLPFDKEKYMRMFPLWQ